jgi:hypothetical protein
MIEDWETGQLFWNCLQNRGSEKEACDDVKEKYLEQLAYDRDLFLFLGTTKQFHWVAPNPFIIIGTFYPRNEIQPELF